MQKQIEEIKDCIDSVYGCDCAYFGVDGLSIADAIYTAGYRKQSEGAWIWTENGEADYEKYWVCSVCKEHDFVKTKFCSNCGAKMKGADNEKAD